MVKLLKLNEVDLTKLRANRVSGRESRHVPDRPAKYSMQIRSNRLPTISRCTVCNRELFVVGVTKTKNVKYCTRCENIPEG